jgi:hypothetical protein
MSDGDLFVKEEYYVCLRTMFSDKFYETSNFPRGQIVFSKNKKYKTHTTIINTDIDSYIIKEIYSPYVDKKIAVKDTFIDKYFININSYRKEKINNII